MGKAKSKKHIGCIYSLDWTIGLDYWTGVDVNCACSKRTNCVIKKNIPYSCMATPHGTYVYREYTELVFMVLCVSSLSEVMDATVASYHLFSLLIHVYYIPRIQG